MPFEPDDFATFATYKAKLNKEEKTVGGNGHFALYKDFPFKTGAKRSVVILGKAKPAKEITDLMKNSSVKCTASGACAAGADGLIFVVETGDLNAAVLDNVGLGTPSSIRKELAFKPAQNPAGTQAPDAATGSPASDAKKPSITMGGGTKEFVAQRTALLQFTKDALARMQAHHTAATTLSANVKQLVDPLNGGKVPKAGLQRFRALVVKYQADADAGLQATQNTDTTDGEHIARERQVKTANYKIPEDVAKDLTVQYRAIFKEATDNSYVRTQVFREARNTYQFMISDLAQALDVIDKGAVTADTGLASLESLLALIGRIVRMFENNYRANAESLRGTLDRGGINTDQKKVALEQSIQTVEVKKANMTDAVAQLKTVMERALALAKTFPVEPRIKACVDKIKAEYGKCVTMKHQYDADVKTADDYHAEVSRQLS